MYVLLGIGLLLGVGLPLAFVLGQTTLTGAVLFQGNLAITGALSKGSGTFVIDHPLDPANTLLYHSFVESPEVKNIYDGVVTLDDEGSARIVLPDYFMALNGDYRYHFFPIGQAMSGLYIAEEISNNEFVIAGGVPQGKISWQVSGNRHDPYILANPIVPEVEKGVEEIVVKGECLYEPLCEE